jgi:hypothetical protein
MEMTMVNSYEDWIELYKINFLGVQLENINDQRWLKY